MSILESLSVETNFSNHQGPFLISMALSSYSLQESSFIKKNRKLLEEENI